jgi:hypothetical protein
MALGPKLISDGHRVDAKSRLPGRFVSGAMRFAMVGAAERHRELVTDLAPHGAGLRKSQMMGVGWLPAAQQARERGNPLKMGLAAPAWRAHGDGARGHGVVGLGRLLRMAGGRRRGQGCALGAGDHGGKPTKRLEFDAMAGKVPAEGKSAGRLPHPVAEFAEAAFEDIPVQRREFLGVLGGAAIAWPVLMAARSLSAPIRRPLSCYTK